MVCWYAVPAVSQERFPLGLAGVWCLDRPLEQENVAELAAADAWMRHGGCRWRWPQVFVLYSSQAGPELVRVQVELVSAPEFFAEVLPAEVD